jgi:hypothetical protein
MRPLGRQAEPASFERRCDGLKQPRQSDLGSKGWLVGMALGVHLGAFLVQIIEHVIVNSAKEPSARMYGVRPRRAKLNMNERS